MVIGRYQILAVGCFLILSAAANGQSSVPSTPPLTARIALPKPLPPPARVTQHMISDADIEANIDASITGADRAVVKRDMLQLRPTHRDRVIILYGNRILSNHTNLINSGRMVPIRSDIPSPARKTASLGAQLASLMGQGGRGLGVASGLLPASELGDGTKTIAQGVGCVSAPSSSTTGPFRLAYSSCGYSYISGSLTLPSCSLTGSSHSNLPPGAASDMGFAYMGAFSDTGDNADLGLQYSAQNDWYNHYISMYSLHGAATASPAYACGQNISITVYTTDSAINLYTSGTVVRGSDPANPNAVYTDPQGMTSIIDYTDPRAANSHWNPQGTGMFMKRLTTIAQTGGTTITNNNEYFGIDNTNFSNVNDPTYPPSAGYITPLVGWYAMTVGTCYNGGTCGQTTTQPFDASNCTLTEYPVDDSRVIHARYSNGGPCDEEEGHWMHR